MKNLLFASAMRETLNNLGNFYSETGELAMASKYVHRGLIFLNIK